MLQSFRDLDEGDRVDGHDVTVAAPEVKIAALSMAPIRADVSATIVKMVPAHNRGSLKSLRHSLLE